MFQYQAVTSRNNLVGLPSSSNDILQYVTSAASSGQTQYSTAATTTSKVEKKPEPKEQFPCDVCGKTFNSQGSLSRHKSIHFTGDYKYSCDICNKSFSSEYNMGVHKSIKHKIPQFNCEICGKIFEDKETLARHETTHASEFKHTCDVCNKTFSSQYNMEVHKSINHKQYKCDMCSETFSQKTKLAHHIKLHAAVKQGWPTAPTAHQQNYFQGYRPQPPMSRSILKQPHKSRFSTS